MSETPATGFSFRRQYAEPLRTADPKPQALELMVESFVHRLPAQQPLLDELRRDHLVTAHGVGLSIGSVDRPPAQYFDDIARVLEQIEPVCYSDHLAVTFSDGRDIGQLTPLLYDEASLEVVVANLEHAQRVVGMMPSLELISEPFRLPGSAWNQAQFAAEAHRATGCGLHADMANMYIDGQNFGFDPLEFIDTLPPDAIDVVHVVGYGTLEDGELADSHDCNTQPPVLDLLEYLLQRSRPKAVIVERDGKLPSFEDLMAEVERVASVVARMETR